MNFKDAIRDTLPIFVSYFALSFSFGILATKEGLNPYLTILMSVIIYSGALQFLLIGIYSKLSLIDIFITSFLFNFRQLFYSLTFLDRYKNQFYKIFTLTDETFALLSKRKVNKDYEFYVSILNHFYWIIGTILGVVFASYVEFKLKGLDFVLVSLFVVILLENILKEKRVFPLFVGVFSYFLFYFLGVSNILIFSIFLSFIIILLKSKRSKSD
jgi:4-azaleucine resistance transporter AzlC